ncbi:hypothetical protein [Gulosibacter molinativorax]|uniref:DUF4175 domain-containing protein n=1 Tax=Gulosibacter molinativorax TaxID=256821 RepID=A0ABT7C812_9MICO|nr:hypothetical protein [Gulosibacter molinativorax]MDJ1371334.1 hypothetical protein [Gulosibacter molinativorax]QUY63602.1 Hypotetical protein [Gulosibacter molinativorax]
MSDAPRRLRLGMLVLTPFLIFALVLGMVAARPTLSPGQLVLVTWIGAFLLGGWLFILREYLPGRAREQFRRISLVIITLALVGVGIGTIWFGVESLVNGEDALRSLLMIGAGIVVIGLGGMLVFRKGVGTFRDRGD